MTPRPEADRPCSRCGLPKPVLGLGSDGACLDCRLEPLRSAVPPLSATQRRKLEKRPRWDGPWPEA